MVALSKSLKGGCMEKQCYVMLSLIRYDDRLMPMSRIFYADLCSLITSRRGCAVNDRYFANLYNCSERQVRAWRKELLEYKYIYEKADLETGIKYMYPTNTLEEQIEIHNALNKPKMIDITYTTADGRVLKSANEAKLYFQALINSKRTLPEDCKNKIFMFLNTFLECIFDGSYLNKKYAGSFVSTKEFFEFVLQNMTVEEIYAKAMYVYDEDIFPTIRQVDYYILTILSKAYRDEFSSEIKHRYLKEKRKGAEL